MIRGRYRWKLLGESIKHGHDRKPSVVRKSYRGLLILLVLVFGWLTSRAFFLQITLGARNRLLSDSNRIDVRDIPADRGVIVDRRGAILARNGLREDKKLVREYPQGEVATTVVGYVGVPSEGVGRTVLEGKTGVEKSFDQLLRGLPGRELVEENARGQELGVVRQSDPVAGETLRLTIDAELNKKIRQIFIERENKLAVEPDGRAVRGAVVVSRTATGEILGLMSWPTYDANLFSGLQPMDGLGYQSIDEVLKDTIDKPMFNRVLGGAYPPGSVYKLITAVAGLEEGKITEGTRVVDTGELKVGSYRYGNWYFDQYGRTEGEIGLVRALARSNDIYFYKAGEWLGVDLMEKWAKKFGLGAKTQVELPGEVPGLVPNRLAKERLTGERWFLGDTYHLAIGQGDTLVTPLQVNMYTSAVVTGRLCKPILVANDKFLISNTQCQNLNISQKTRDIVIRGMEEVCQSGGTAFTFFDFESRYGVQPACKTGTAQHGGEQTASHAWITLVVPKKGGWYDQGVTITVLLEEAGEGSYEAGPVATVVAEYLMENRLDFDL